MTHPRKILVLDGISGIPLGREVCETFNEIGIPTAHFNCLKAPHRTLYSVRSAWAKLRNRADTPGKDSFYLLPKLLEHTLHELISLEKPSHILVIGFIYKFFSPHHLRQIADQAKARLFLYDTDTCNLYGRRREFIFFVENELPVYDHIFSCSAVTTRLFSDTLGLRSASVPFGAKPQASNRKREQGPMAFPETSPGIDVLFVGSSDLRRIFLLEGIRDHVHVRGNRWQRNYPLISPALRQRIDDRPVWGEELTLLLARTKIVLNITRSDFHGAETGINLRIFEALAAGCFLLTDHSDELASLFKIGEELETFRSSSELLEKVHYYLAHPEERQRIADTGAEAFHKRHTWHARITHEMLPLLAQ